MLTLDFEGNSDYSFVGDFYNGGTNSAGESGANLGVSFGPDTLAVANSADFTYYSNAPTPGAIMAPIGADAAMNVATGIYGFFSLFYSTAADVSIDVFSGLNGSGDLLSSLTLFANAQNGCSDTLYCNWDLAELSFGGVAQSIQFGGAAGAGFDNVTFAVPSPATNGLMLTGLGGLALLGRRRRNA